VIKNIIKLILPTLALVLLLIPIVTSSLLDLKQKKVNELSLKQRQAQKEAEAKIYLTGKFDPGVREGGVQHQRTHNVLKKRNFGRLFKNGRSGG